MSMSSIISPTAKGSSSQRGGITIIVTLMLLVLLTISAVAMSRNAFREVVISGTTRQGSMVRNMPEASNNVQKC